MYMYSVCTCSCNVVCIIHHYSSMSYRKKWLLTVASMLHLTPLTPVGVSPSHYYHIRNYQDLLSQATTWQEAGEYNRSVETLLQLTVNMCDDQQLLIDTWTRVCVHVHECVCVGLLNGWIQCTCTCMYHHYCTCIYVYNCRYDNCVCVGS